MKPDLLGPVRVARPAQPKWRQSQILVEKVKLDLLGPQLARPVPQLQQQQGLLVKARLLECAKCSADAVGWRR